MLRPLLIVLLAFAPAVKFDASADFSLKHNPDGVWQYGYSAGNSLAPDQFRLDRSADTKGAIGFWHPAPNRGPGPGYYPYVAYNTTQTSQLGSANGWAVRAGELAMEASNTGQYSIVRFTAPEDGTYKVTAQFAGVHFGLSTTDVHVLHNGTSLFAAVIDGYGGDSGFHRIQGARPTAKYAGEVHLQRNDTITFAVGYGTNKTNFGDTTGLIARVEKLTTEHGSSRRGAFGSRLSGTAQWD